MDGTLVDTEPYWMTAERELVHEWGGTWTHEDGLQLVGQGLWSSALVFQSRGVKLTPQEIIDWLTDRVTVQIEEHVPWRPGARELLAEVREAGIPTALVTMSIRRMADQIAGFLDEELGRPAFDVVVAGDEVERPKPYPDAYLRAAELLGVEIADCVAIEDSEPGVAAAVASGATTFAVPFHVPLPESPAYTRLPNGLDGIRLDDLAASGALR
ncbi:HAD family hydrolase [Protaetiibacter intestinalis]|uniref:HAD family phosphatase n=1 Tax=Protaetiibacter intestinalis TaxID=2419774 RepID=A0A387B9I5_9MICO|nr:HAD family phosphatase [Protaetiibacter intestinalis]AYF99013.1 HAD family phosphatase [Protaetiibacter intestinalis]